MCERSLWCDVVIKRAVNVELNEIQDQVIWHTDGAGGYNVKCIMPGMQR